jgi:excisionase family DNA binding protein
MTETGRKKAAIPEYLTTQEVADRLRVTRRTVYNWLLNGVLDADKAGPKIWLISEAHLQAFLDRSRPLPRRTSYAADPSKWGRAGRKPGKRAAPAAAAGSSPPAPARGIDMGELVEVFRQRFGEGEHLDGEDFEVKDGAWGVFEPPAPSRPSRPSLPPANIPSANKKRGSRRR